MTLYTNDNTVWKVNDPHVNDGGIVKPVNTGYVNENGIWKEMYESGPPTVIGEFSQGGYYFGEFNGYHLLCAPIAGASSLAYNTSNVSTPGEPRSETDGYYNTCICVQTWEHPAANFCAGLTIDGYSDWYLPAIDELQLLYESKSILEGAGSGTFPAERHWSSTEYANNPKNAWHLDFGKPLKNYYSKYSVYKVRAIRRWTP